MASTAITHPLNIASSLLATALRTGVGIVTRGDTAVPEQLLELYEFEGCPHCRLVREVLTELDLDAQIFPCPKGGKRYRRKVIERGGKAQFPYLIDPNTGTEMYESADIIRYLFTTYGSGQVPLHWQAVELQRVGSVLAGAARMGAGVRVRPARAAEQPLELYSFESSPFARPVRDLLCELEISYIVRSVGRNALADWVPPALRDAFNVASEPRTRNRRALLERAGRISVPYLVDPNTNIELAESEEIMKYLEETYGL